MSGLLIAAGGVCVFTTLSAAGLLVALRRQERLAARILSVQRGVVREHTRGKPESTLLRLVAAIGTGVARSGLLSSGTLEQLQQTLTAAGLRGSNGLALFVGSKLLLAAVLPAAAWLWLHHLAIASLTRNALIAAAAVAGLLLPDYAVRSSRARHLKRLEAQVPDALDMMVICSEAGLGLEAAVDRVAQEMEGGYPAVAFELGQTSNELRYTSDRRVALQNLGTRTGLDSLKRLGGTLVQSMHYGTPLSHALRTLSAEMRGEMLVRFESRAARLPVLLTLPMIIFILPTVFLIVGGPAMIKVLASLHH